MNYFNGQRCLTSDKPFDIVADADHDPDPIIFNGIFTTAGHGQL